MSQQLEFNATSGLTLTAKLFGIGSDTVVATAASVTEKTNHKNRYVAEFDVPDGAYCLVAFVGTVGGFANELYDIEGDGTFYPRSELHLLASIPHVGSTIRVRNTETNAAAEVVIEDPS